MVYKDCWDLLDLLEKRVPWETLGAEESLVVPDFEAIQVLTEMLGQLA